MSLNEREKAVNERGGKEDMRGKNTREMGTFGGSIIFSYWEIVLEHFYFWGEIGRLYYWFWLEKLVVGLLQGITCC